MSREKSNKLENLRSRRKELGYTQQEIAEKLFIGQDTYSNYENGNTLIPSDILIKLSSILKVSCDYILGVSNSLNIGNREIMAYTGLNEQAIENLRGLYDNIVEQAALSVVASYYGITRTPYNPLKTLNLILNSPACEGLLYAIEDYINPEYDKPMCFVAAGETVGGIRTQKADYHIPQNQIHKKPRHDETGYDNYLPLVKDENTPSDYRAVKIDNSFLESVAMIQIQKHIDTIKSGAVSEI